MKQVIDRRIDYATADAARARARFAATLQTLRARLDPKTIAQDTFEQAKTSATDLLGEATEAARSRPWLLALAASLVGLALTVRSRRKSDEQPTSSA